MTKFFSLLHNQTIHPATERKLIPQEEYSQLLSAEELVEKTKADTELYKEETHKECEALKEKAKEEGYQEGLIQFNAHALQFEKNLAALRLDLQKQILPLALKAAKKIVGKELELHPETIVDIVMQTLAPVTQNEQITIFVNKADKEILETQKEKIKGLLDQVKSLVIQEQADISPGGCMIKTETGIINATIENQWAALEAAFQRYLQKS